MTTRNDSNTTPSAGQFWENTKEHLSPHCQRADRGAQSAPGSEAIRI